MAPRRSRGERFPTVPNPPIAMKTLVLALSIVIPAAAAATVLQDAMQPTEPQAQHAWLQRLIGEWDAVSEATMEPGGEPMRMESTESVRAFGELWIVAEGNFDLGGPPLRSMMTLGYDPRRDAFVGTWIDTMHATLWHYVGQLDDEERVLTLETEGPSFDDADTTARYRDRIELVDADHKVLTSSVEDGAGGWTTFLRAEYRRRK